MFWPLDHDATGATSTVQIVRMLESFTASNAKFTEEARVAAWRKRELCIESQRIAARLEPRPLVGQLTVNCPTRRQLKQPPGRFAFYQGAF